MQKIGLVLGGGGAKGSFQIGVLKALMEHNILNKVKIVSGTSIGALNSCMVIGKMSYSEMINVWEVMNNKNLYSQGLSRLKNDRLGLFDQKLMYETMQDLQSKESITTSDIKGYATVARIKNNDVASQIKRSEMISEILFLNEARDPHLVVLASSSIPLVFGPTKILDRYYLDGGLVNNLPVNVMVDHKCDVILVVGLNPHYDLSAFAKDYLVIDFSTNKNLTHTILGLFDFNSNLMYKRVEDGYDQANTLIEELKALKILTNKGFKKNEKGLYKLSRFNRLEIIKEDK